MAIKKLKQAITERGLTTAQLAEKTGVNTRTINGWLYGKQPNPTVKDFAKTAAALGVSMEYLLSGKDGSGLTDEETLLLSLFRETPKQRRALLIRLAGVLKDG
jgi:transcriptional regulator with XRE-family HTH domain